MNLKPIKVIFLSLVFLGTLIIASFSAFVFATLSQLEGIQVLETYKPPTPTQILDVNNELIAEFYRERRELVNFTDLSPKLIQATLSIEDKRFFSHYGIDFIRILKAIWVNSLALEKLQGGSTITIQLSKLIFLHHKKTFTRKLVELWYAIQIEKQYTKEEILKFYFNQVNYGHGSYGVGAASRFFFNKKVSDISTAEAAILAGIPKSPVYYSPIRYPERASERHQTVFSAMVRNGFIDQKTASIEYQNFWQYFASDNRNLQSTFGGLSKNQAPYFTEYIRAKLEKEFPKDELYEKGIRVYTTLNLKHQRIAQKNLWKTLEEQDEYKTKLDKSIPEKASLEVINNLSVFANILNLPQLKFQERVDQKLAVNEINSVQGILKDIGTLFSLPEISRVGHHNYQNDKIKFAFNKKAQGAIISIEPKTGFITAMVGGSPFNYNNQFNRALNLERQIGSILKPFIFALAIDKNILRANTILNDAPTQFGNYVPKNYSSKFLGKVTVRDALRKSVNVLAVETLDRIGVMSARNKLAQIFRAYTERSINTKFPKDLTLALGTGSFSVLSVAVAYAVLANEGKEVIPKTIRYVTDQNGEMLRNYEKEYVKYQPKQLIDESTAFIIRDIINDVFSPGGTAYKPKLTKDFPQIKNSFGKTGTTSNWKDAWFAGANNHLSTAIWIGYDDNRSLGRHHTGGRMAAPIWINFQKQALHDIPLVKSVQPKGVITKKVCLSCAGIAGPDCPKNQVRSEYFKIDNYPNEVCYNPLAQKKKKKQFKNFIRNYKNKDRFTPLYNE